MGVKNVSSHCSEINLVPDQTTPLFLSCFKRVVVRRGRKVVCDNGKTFKVDAKAIPQVYEVYIGVEGNNCLRIEKRWGRGVDGSRKFRSILTDMK